MRSPLDRCRGLAALALLLVCAPARAELSAEVDAFGTYVRTVLVTSGSERRLKIWSPFRSRATGLMLNSAGDATGDGWPAIVESPVDRKPWVVWSHFDGSGFDLAWSRFEAGKWLPVQSLLPPDDGAPDLDPVIAFDESGRPYVVWWRNQQGRGQVYLSVFLATRWMGALPVSDTDEDARTPTLVTLAGGQLQISYVTPAGKVTKVVVPKFGDTITDDVNPFDTFRVTWNGGKLLGF